MMKRDEILILPNIDMHIDKWICGSLAKMARMGNQSGLGFRYKARQSKAYHGRWLDLVFYLSLFN